MKLYWSYKSIPELDHLPESERRRLYQFYARKVFRTRQFWFFFILYFLIFELVYSIYGVVAGIFVIVIFAPIKLQIIIKIIRNMIKAHFKEGRHIVDG